MADTKITALAAIGANPINVATFPIPMVDLLDTSMAASGTTKKVTVNQILQAGGTATLASATISGDLTVDTSTLKVDSANNRVGIGTATPAVDLHIQAAGTASAEVRLASATRSYSVLSSGSGYGSANNLVIYDITGSAERWRLDNTGVQTWSNVGGVAGTAMTLNANGLGVGGSPTAKLSVVATGKGFVFGSTSATGAYAAWQYNSADVGYVGNGTSIVAGAAATDFGLTSSAGGKLWLGSNNGASYAVLDSSGNVGIGVTPSYLLHTAVASGANRNIARFQVTGASNGLTITWNHATTKMIVNFSNLPTSSAGLASGDLWIDTAAGNTLKVA